MLRIDITDGIPKQAAVNWCKGCSRYLSPPTQWVICDMESRELLAICLRKLKGLNKVRLIDAGFIWTEPHSKRLRVKLTIQKEVSIRLVSCDLGNELKLMRLMDELGLLVDYPSTNL
jgi:NMD protein affecting ribosome stability and mRNA decay